jgi:hypothetical protein
MQKTKKFLRLMIHQVKLQFMCMDISCILVRVGWILFFLVGCYHFANSQSNQRMFNQTVDYVNCEFSKQSLKEFNEDIYNKYLQEFPNCNGTNSSFADDLKEFLKANNVKGTYELAQAINGFKQKYNTEFTPGDEVDEEDIYNLVKRDIFNIPKVKAFESNHKNTFPFLRTSIVKQLQLQLVPDELMTNNNLLSEPSADNEYMQSDDGYEYEETMEEDRNPDRFNSNQDYSGNGIISRRDILWLFSLLMFGLLAFYFIRSVMPRYTVNQNYQSIQIDDDKTKNLLDQLFKKVKDLRKEHSELIEELEVLNHRFNRLDKTTDINKTAIESMHETIENSLEEADEDDESLEEMTALLDNFYLPIPNSDGSFNAEDALEEFKRTETVYQFKIVSKDPLRAEFKIYDDVATMLRALDDPDVHLKPACRSNAIIPISATKIMTDEPGLAVFRNNEWRVVKKALIHYV